MAWTPGTAGTHRSPTNGGESAPKGSDVDLESVLSIRENLHVTVTAGVLDLADWRFRVMRKSEQNRAPVESQFFEDVDSLVREAVQNSLDAAVRTENPAAPVRVRFFVSGTEGAVPRDRAREWMRGLEPHLRSALEDLPNIDSDMPFLAVEDFGTRGLQGRTEIFREADIHEGERADFFYFWRNVGMTGKSGTERGSWGLGKAVYAASSQVHAMFGWSVREGSPRSVLMGQASLKLHSLKDSKGVLQQHDAYGFFGQFVDGEDSSFATPLDDQRLIASFREDFHLRRRPEDTGLSLVIPFPREEFLNGDGTERLVRATILHFAYPILSGQLTVEVSSPSGSQVVDAPHIEERLKSLNWVGNEAKRDRILELLDLARWTLANRDQALRLSTTDTLAAKWERISYPEPQWTEARGAFLAREPVGFEVPVIVRPKQKEKVESSFHVFLRQRETSQANLVHFIRQGLTISEVANVPGTGLVGIVLIDDESLSKLLRDSENPAHTRWMPRSEKLKARYQGGAERIDFVTNAPRVLLRRLSEADKEVDSEMLADFFPEVEKDAPTPTKVGGGKKGKKTTPLPPPPPPKPRPLTVTKVDGGFVITRDPNVPVEEQNDELLVEAAYDCAGANPFKAWEEYDFRVDRDLKLEIEDGSIVRAEQNHLRVRPGPGMKLRVTGFATARDVIVRHRWIRGARGDA